ncbi:MAG TPA: hypothetical protein DDW20_04755 [Firmicutes bacterium]|nr:hypothetical protein [Bacillota bacterium]
MKIIIIGAGTSGLTASINLKRIHKSSDILVIEHLNKPFKKILATGNGKCNISNSNIDISKFNNPIFVKNIFGKDYFSKINSFLDSVHIKTKEVNELIYPITESSETIRNAFLNEVHKLGIKIHVDEELIDYKIDNNQIIVFTNKNKYVCDKLIITTGGCSSPKLGSDGKIFEILKRHDYKISKVYPGLCPINTKENTKELDGLRIKGLVSLIKDDKLVYQEDGEVLFKKHGLSGIVIFNIASLIARDINHKYKISINTLPKFNKETLINELLKYGKDVFLCEYVHPLLKKYLLDQKLDIISSLTNLTFNFDSLYDFEFSQVSVGGLSIDNINDDMSSKIEKNVYFAGEILNVDGPCGGYNLTFAILSALNIN